MNLPKATSLEWLRELIVISINSRSNDFVVRRIERDARLLLDKRVEQPELCCLVLVSTAFLRGDECVRAVDAAYALARYDVVIMSNSASLLINLGLPRLAVIYARRLAALCNADARQAVNAVNVLYAALHIEEAAAFLWEVEKKLPPGAGSILAAQLDGVSVSFQASDVGVELPVALMETAVSAIESEGYSIRYTAPVHCLDNTLGYELYVDQSSSQCANLSFSIADALTEKFDDPFPELITFGCRPRASYIPAGKIIELAA